ncbi:MAG: hypothetical protein PHU25_22370 [Deltaproteobacteria bacterium]|nr:hypothetical protein [Deltaproteobacteria bacterium]
MRAAFRNALVRLLVLCATLAAVPVRAQMLNDHHYPVGHRAGGMGGAAVAMSGDAAIAFYNPAGLGYLEAESFSASVAGYGVMQLDVPHMAKLSDAEGGRTATSGEGASYSLQAFPTATSYTNVFAERGGARHVISALMTVPDLEDYRFSSSLVSADPKISWHMEHRTTVRNYWLGLAYGVGYEKVSFGLALFFPLLIAEQMTKESFATQGALTSTYRNYWSYSLSFTPQVGVQVRPTPRWRLGASLAAPSVELGHFGEYHSEIERTTPTGMEWVRFESSSFHVADKQPWRLRMGAGYEVRKTFAVALDVSVYGPVKTYDRIPAFKATRSDNRTFAEETVRLPGEDEVTRVMTPQLNLGFEYWITDEVPVRIGGFTNWSSSVSLADEKALAPLFGNDGVQRPKGSEPPRLQGGGGVLGVGLVQEDQRSWFVALSVAYLKGEIHGVLIKDVDTLETAPFDTEASAIVGVLLVAGTFEIMPIRLAFPG